MTIKKKMLLTTMATLYHSDWLELAQCGGRAHGLL